MTTMTSVCVQLIYIYRKTLSEIKSTKTEKTFFNLTDFCHTAAGILFLHTVCWGREHLYTFLLGFRFNSSVYVCVCVFYCIHSNSSELSKEERG